MGNWVCLRPCEKQCASNIHSQRCSASDIKKVPKVETYWQNVLAWNYFLCILTIFLDNVNFANDIYQLLQYKRSINHFSTTSPANTKKQQTTTNWLRFPWYFDKNDNSPINSCPNWNSIHASFMRMSDFCCLCTCLYIVYWTYILKS